MPSNACLSPPSLIVMTINAKITALADVADSKKMKMIFNGVFVFTALSLLTLCIHISAQAADQTNQTTAAALDHLQGIWEGKQQSGDKVSIKVTGHLLRYEGQSRNDWYEVTFTLPEKTDPQELRATITGCQRTNDIGAVVRAIFKIEDGTLTLVGIQDRDKEPPQGFTNNKPQLKIQDESFSLSSSLAGAAGGPKAFEDDSVFRYELQKVRPQKENANGPPTK